MYMQRRKWREWGRVRIPDHWAFTFSTIATNASQVMGSILPISILRLAYMLLPLTTKVRCSALEFKSNMVRISGSFNTQRCKCGHGCPQWCSWYQIIHAIQLPLAYFHCTYEVADEYIALLGESDKGIQGLNEGHQGYHPQEACWVTQHIEDNLHICKSIHIKK